jgi:hypothetical protein
MAYRDRSWIKFSKEQEITWDLLLRWERMYRDRLKDEWLTSDTWTYDLYSAVLCRSVISWYIELQYARSVWVWNLVCDIKGGTQTEGVWEQGAD